MSNGWSPTDISLQGKVVAGIVTNEPLTKEATVSAGGALNGIIKLKVASVTQVGTITPKIQTAVGNDWVDVKSGSAITAAGTQYIRWNIEVSGDQSALPLLAKLRVVLTTTDASDTLTVTSCDLLQQL
jgi:uncharacterized membrane protein